MCVSIFPACTDVHNWCLRPEEGAGSPETAVTDVCELPCDGCWGGTQPPAREAGVLQCGAALYCVVLLPCVLEFYGEHEPSLGEKAPTCKISSKTLTLQFIFPSV